MIARVLCVFVLFAGIALSANAQSVDTLSRYEMRGFETQIWDHDVDYFARPLMLHRTSNTNAIHRIAFNILRYETYCAQWRRVCVRRDHQGRCVRYERRCVRVARRTYRVPARRIELNFRDLPELEEGQTENYELRIYKQRPIGDNGTDRVRTNLWADETIVPTNVRKVGDFRYYLIPAEEE